MAQPTESGIQFLTLQVESVLKKFGLENQYELSPDFVKEGSLLRVTLKRKTGYEAADLSRMFSYMTSDKVGLALLSVDMGRLDVSRPISIWRPKFFQVTSAESAAANGINTPERLAAVTQAISQLGNSMKAAVISNL